MKKLLIMSLVICSSLAFLRFSTTLSHKIKGKVLGDGIGISFARVRIQTSENYIMTDKNGDFEIPLPYNADSIVITAWADGYYNGATKVYLNEKAVNINLDKLYKIDNPDYKWTDPEPDPENRGNCGNCHPVMLKEQWAKSAHAKSAINPFFLAMYYGKDTSLLYERGKGFRKDFPRSNGNCASCHIPGAAADNPSGKDPISVEEVNRHGVFCDVCHKMSGVKQPVHESEAGTSSISFLRPPAGKSIFFGPYEDVDKPDVYLPLIRESEYCGPCHTGKSGDVEIYNSYNEWKSSSYPAKGIQCQTCHMAPDGITTNFAPGKGGLERNPSTIPTHLFPGSRDPEFLANALTMNFSVERNSDFIKIKVILNNDKTGHNIPTGSPSRNMILLVEAVSENGERLDFISGGRVPSWGGTGTTGEGNYANHPGKGFAKILSDRQGHSPASDWNAAGILSDNRIAAQTSDISDYYFRAPGKSSKVKVNIKLIYRRFFKETMDGKGFSLGDIIMKSDSIGC
jgi:hypothetical protein